MVDEVRIHPEAIKYLKKLPKSVRNNIRDHLEKLIDDSERKKLDIKKKKGTKGRQDLYRLRVGKYRVVFAYEDGIYWVTEIFPRGRVYR